LSSLDIQGRKSDPLPLEEMVRPILRSLGVDKATLDPQAHCKIRAFTKMRCEGPFPDSCKVSIPFTDNFKAVFAADMKMLLPTRVLPCLTSICMHSSISTCDCNLAEINHFRNIPPSLPHSLKTSSWSLKNWASLR
jgi:hypothetical protein